MPGVHVVLQLTNRFATVPTVGQTSHQWYLLRKKLRPLTCVSASTQRTLGSAMALTKTCNQRTTQPASFPRPGFSALEIGE